MVLTTIDIEHGLEKLREQMEGLKPEALNAVVDRAAFETLAALIEATPRKWFGQVRASWRIENRGVGSRVVRNDNKIMLFLEEGTRDHGPVSAKFLYIPLTRGAVRWRPGLVRGVDYILSKKVKGIKAMHIVATQRQIAMERLYNLLKQTVASALGNG